MARNVPENRQADIYKKVRTASCDSEDAEGWALVGLVNTASRRRKGEGGERGQTMRVIRTRRMRERRPILKLCERTEENLVVWDAECSVQYPTKRDDCAVDVQR